MDWQRIVFTEHMTEAAVALGVCHVVFDFGPHERATYEIRVFRVVKGTGAPFFAVGQNRDQPDAFRPFGEGESAEAAAQACLESAGVHHRRQERQGG